ncbi:MAG: EAL domain-containing protein [Novosphingobium sp.]
MTRSNSGSAGPDKYDQPDGQSSKAGQDVLLLGISMAAIIMFVGTGGRAMPKVVQSLQGIGVGPDQVLTNALLLNIALIIFGWRRYRDLQEQVKVRSQAESQARVLAETDPLTGCLNRRSMGEATDALNRSCSDNGEKIALLMIDLDNFKRLNDTNGHAAGDAVLRETVRRIGEILPERSLLARLGGDEFACVVPFTPLRTDRVDRIAARLIDAVSMPVIVDGMTLEGISISMGLARSDQPHLQRHQGTASASDDLMHMADIAMYQAKKTGKNRYFWFEPQMETELRFRTELETGIRAGISRGEFVPFYEPQVDLATGRISGFEMLARWQSPTLGLVGPEVFIPIAEEIGVITELSEALVQQALEDAREWHPDLTLSVNISPVQLRDPWFAQRLLKQLVRANFPPQRLEIEITESCLHENLGLVRSLVTSLKNQGIKINLDDFGTGYSSLSQLRTLPFDRIKIDRSFIATLSHNADSMTIVKAIAALGSGLGLPITAEGVEDADVVDALRKIGDFKAQGHLFGRPVAAAEILSQLGELGMLRNIEYLPEATATIAAEGQSAPRTASA